MEHTKALYTALRLQALEDPSFAVDAWKVQDFRKASMDELFTALAAREVVLDKMAFAAFVDEYDSPEELAEALAIDVSEEELDFIYLVIFELWRRMFPEKQTVSLLADELDYQILLYDREELLSVEPLDDAIASFYEALKEAVDMGADPKEAFNAMQEETAHDLHSFLYDYISELLEQKQYVFAEELLEQFYPFVETHAFFDFLRAKLAGRDWPKRACGIIGDIVTKYDADLYLNLDILEYLVQLPFRELFSEVATRTIPLVSDEEDIEEFIRITDEFLAQNGLSDAHLVLHGIKACSCIDEKKQKLADLYRG